MYYGYVYMYTRGNSPSPWSIPVVGIDSPQLIRTTQDVVQFDGDVALILELLVQRCTASPVRRELGGSGIASRVRVKWNVNGI